MLYKLHQKNIAYGVVNSPGVCGCGWRSAVTPDVPVTGTPLPTNTPS